MPPVAAASSNAVVRPVVPAGAGTEEAHVGSTSVEWSPVGGGTATVTTHDPLPMPIGLGLGALSLGTLFGSGLVGARAGASARAAALDAGMSVAEAAARAARTRNVWAIGGAVASMGIIAATGIASDHGREHTETRSMSRAEFDAFRAHEAPSFTESLPAFGAGLAGGAIAGAVTSRLVANAPLPIKVGLPAAAMFLGAIGAYQGAEALRRASSNS